MTKRQKLERKLGNAIRAIHGGRHTAPQPAHKPRAVRLAKRLLDSGRPLPEVIVWAARKSGIVAS